MLGADTARPEFARTTLVGLTIACPRGEESADCPLYKMRQRTFSEKIEWVKSLSDTELSAAYGAHCACLEPDRDFWLIYSKEFHAPCSDLWLAERRF